MYELIINTIEKLWNRRYCQKIVSYITVGTTISKFKSTAFVKNSFKKPHKNWATNTEVDFEVVKSVVMFRFSFCPATTKEK